MVIRDNDSLNHLTDYRDTHIDTIGKLNYIFTNQVIDFLNASVKYSIVDSWGYLNKETAEWSGMVGELLQDKADLGATPLFYLAGRIPLIQYVARTTRTTINFVFQAPKLSITDNIFLLPFSRTVWTCIILLIPLLGIALTLTTYAEWKIASKKNAPNTRLSVKDSILVVFTAMCQQGSFIMPRSISARFLMILMFLILMFLYASYSAHIVALLQSPSSKIKTLEDLLKSRIKLGAEDTVYNKFYIPVIPLKILFL